MEVSKKGTNNVQRCEICQADFLSNAEYALHEFTKKHCDNLIKVARNKPVVSKAKVKIEPPQEKVPAKVNTVTQSGSFSLYGYFVPGETYTVGEVSKEFNTDYDPYLQKFAENPYKKKPVSNPITTQATTNVSFSRKKKKKIKTCHICNVTLSTVPEYETHMKSTQHILKLKMTGIGVSAHFVKGSSDLHTTDVSDEKQMTEESSVETPVTTSSSPFPLLYCQDCELLLNSPQQYNAHVAGRSHKESARKKAELKEKKEKIQEPTPNQLYCYSCKVSVNQLYQFNEHKYGKKHKMKCKQLIQNGITIPPEERVPGLDIPKEDGPAIYPELYQKYILSKQAINSHNIEVSELNIVTGVYPCKVCNEKFETINEYTKHYQNARHYASDRPDYIENKCSSPLTPIQKTNSELSSCADETDQLKIESSQISNSKDQTDSENENDYKMIIVADSDPIKCNICNQDFSTQSQYEVHLTKENHVKNILEIKTKGKTDSEILQIIFSDRTFVKPNNLRKLSCSFCTVITENNKEFQQHLRSIVHKYTIKDYKKKRLMEIKSLVGVNEQGLYFCKICKEGWSNLIEFIQHLHLAKHKSILSSERAKKIIAKRRLLNLQKKRLKLSKKKFSWRKKNPGVRTKISGVATDLKTGEQALVPNLESLELKIDPAKNVTLDLPEVKVSQNKNPKRRKMQLKNRYSNEIPSLLSAPCIPPFFSVPTRSRQWMLNRPYMYQNSCPPPRYPYGGPYIRNFRYRF